MSNKERERAELSGIVPRLSSTDMDNLVVGMTGSTKRHPKGTLPLPLQHACYTYKHHVAVGKICKKVAWENNYASFSHSLLCIAKDLGAHGVCVCTDITVANR